MGMLKDECLKLSVGMIKMSKQLFKLGDRSIADQILRSATSVGANVSESEYAASRKDFINKLRIALKECNETAYWFEVLRVSGEYENNELEDTCIRIKKMLVSSIKTSESRMKSESVDG